MNGALDDRSSHSAMRSGQPYVSLRFPAIKPARRKLRGRVYDAHDTLPGIPLGLRLRDADESLDRQALRVRKAWQAPTTADG
jgi:hypothetical protein